MIDGIPKEIQNIFVSLEKAGFEIYLVGGSVRNLIMGIPVKDWDFTTNATPEEIQNVFEESHYENTFGTVGIPIKKDGKTILHAEITTYRKESNYENLRHPSILEWGKTLEDDLGRRDFTCNAIAAIIDNGKLNLTDPYDGKRDIEKKTIQTVGDPNERFNEDALRLMRAVRFATQLSFTIEAKTWEALTQNAHLIQHISQERIRDELLKILASEHPYEGIMLLDRSGILDIIIPELSAGKGVSQVRPGRHHTEDVFTHNVLSLKFTPATDPIVRLATLLHDVGKPQVMGKDDQGLVIFYNHEVTGARIAAQIADRFHMSRKEREKIFTLVRWHMFPVDTHITDNAIRRFIRRVGVENVKDMIDLRIGDRLGGGTQTAESWRLKKFKERLEEQLNPPFSLNDLAVDGTDVMRELDLKPGPEVGKILKQLFEEVDQDLSNNTREYLIAKIHEYAKSKK